MGLPEEERLNLLQGVAALKRSMIHNTQTKKKGKGDAGGSVNSRSNAHREIRHADMASSPRWETLGDSPKTP